MRPELLYPILFFVCGIILFIKAIKFILRLVFVFIIIALMILYGIVF